MCDTLIRVLNDRVLFAKNSDRDPNEAQHLDWQPRQTHAAGASVRCTWITIPQVRETHAVLLSRPFWIWGAEIGTNAHGVTIGNQAVFTRQPYAATGLTGMDLLRLALERAATARAAVDVITELLERHGQGGGCGHEHRGFTYHNSFAIADAHGAFILETAGARWQAQAVAGAWSLSNGLTLPGIAAERDVIKTRVSACAARRDRTLAAARAADGVAAMMAALRDHGARAEPTYHWSNGALAAPCVHAGGLLAASQTTASWVAELRPGAVQHWVTATAAPCLGLFKPVRVDAPLALGPPPTDRADDHSLFWRHERLHRAVMRDPARLRPLVIVERDRTEAAWQVAPPSSAAAFAEGDARLAAWTTRVEAAAGATRDTRPAIVRRYWRVRDRRAGLI